MIVCILIDSSNAFNIVYSEETIDLSTTPQNNGQRGMHQRVHYSEVPLYKNT